MKHYIYSSENTEQYFSYKSCTFDSTGNSSFGPVVFLFYGHFKVNSYLTKHIFM